LVPFRLSDGSRLVDDVLSAMRITLLCLIGATLGLHAAAAQTSSRLPDTLRAHLQQDRFQAVTSIRGLPLGVRDELQALFGSNALDIAEPGAAFRATDVVSVPLLPSRRLVMAACSTDHCVVYYERGGIAHTWHAALFHWTPAATRLEWGGVAPGGLRTIDEVRAAFQSGAIKKSIDSW
jgi:hypothetical protein